MTRPSYLRRCPECQATSHPHAPQCTRDASRSPKSTQKAKDSAQARRTPTPNPKPRASGAVAYKPSLVSGASWVVVSRGEPSEYEKACQGPIESAVEAYGLVRDRILREQVEVMYCMALDASYRVTHMAEISRGGTGMCALQVKDVLRLGVVTGASYLVIVHNHPSGDASPSNQDLSLTQSVITGCEAVGLTLLDHVVVGRWSGKDSYTSILQALREVAQSKGHAPEPQTLLHILNTILCGKLETSVERS